LYKEFVTGMRYWIEEDGDRFGGGIKRSGTGSLFISTYFPVVPAWGID